MKKLFTLIAFAGASFCAFSQDFPIPYNPDDDSNGLIGTPDLLSLLALFGEEFSAAVVSEDNESAVMYTGDMAYPLCAQSCRNLPGMWRMPTMEDLGLVWDEIYTFGEMTNTWLGPSATTTDDDEFIFKSFHSGSSIYSENEQLVINSKSPIGSFRCYCAIKEIARVEYKVISLSGICSTCVSEKEELFNQAAQEGWLSLPETLGTGTVTFWRWAD